MTLTAAFGTGEPGCSSACSSPQQVWLILWHQIPFFSFFAHDSGRRVEEAPTNMLIAMGMAAFICIFLGVTLLRLRVAALHL